MPPSDSAKTLAGNKKANECKKINLSMITYHIFREVFFFKRIYLEKLETLKPQNKLNCIKVTDKLSIITCYIFREIRTPKVSSEL